MRNKLISKNLFLLFLLVSILLFGSCNKSNKADDNSVISDTSIMGDINYDAPLYVLSYENIEDEEEKGIVYRELLDFNKLVTDEKQTTVLYFYSDMLKNDYGVTAMLEDMAQQYEGKINFVGIDADSEKDIVRAYGMETFPDFVLVSHNKIASRFDVASREHWEAQDVCNWIGEVVSE